MRFVLPLLLVVAFTLSAAEEKREAEPKKAEPVAEKKAEPIPDIVFKPGTTKEGMELADGKLTFAADGVMKFEGSVTNCATMLAMQMPLVNGDDPLSVGAYELHFRKEHSVTMKKSGLHFHGKWDETAMALIEKAYRVNRAAPETPRATEDKK